jgi:hypothetical protein
MHHNYLHLSNCFLNFARYFEQTFDSYRSCLIEYIESGHVNTFALREEIDMALRDKEFSWKKFAKEREFVTYDDLQTEEEVFIDFQLFTWDILYPEKVLNEEEMQKLKEWMIQFLTERGATRDTNTPARARLKTNKAPRLREAKNE